MEIGQVEIRPGYKQSKLGWIPEDWKILNFSSVTKINQGLQIPIAHRYLEKVENSFFYITNEFLRPNSNTRYYVTNPIDSVKCTAEDILMTRTGNTGEVVTGVDGVFHNNFFKIKFDMKCLHKDYLYYFLVSPHTQFTISKLAGTSTIPDLNHSDFYRIPITIPPLPEQKAIAQVLSTWDNAIENLTQLITEKQQKKKALMQQLLTGNKRFPGFDGVWKEYSYKELLKEVKRPVKWDDNELYHLLSVRRRSGGLFERDSLYGHQILTKNLRTAKAGDFLISKMQILHGASAVATEEFDDKKISGSYIAVRSRDEKVLDINFLDWYSKMPYFYHQTYISSYGVHIEKMTFDFKSFLKLEMKVPGLKEQQKIVATLESAENEINILNKKLDALKDQKKGLMQQLLTGKKRLSY